jgi:2-dehydro-3-deoxy-D-arabinonate dehydratase
MYLTRHQTQLGPRWAVDGKFLPQTTSLEFLLELPAARLAAVLQAIATDEDAEGAPLAPIEPSQEVWASGVTYLRSRDARQTESDVGDVYERVYDAERPEIFLKAVGWRVVEHRQSIRVRRDSGWNVPEPELTLVINGQGVIVGYCAGNDVSSRAIEGANPLYLPQAKIYNGSCALGPGIQLAGAGEMRSFGVQLEIARNGAVIFRGETGIDQMKRSLEELADYLYRELDFPTGVFLMTGTGIVPPDEFSLQAGDLVKITVGSLTLENEVQA